MRPCAYTATSNQFNFKANYRFTHNNWAAHLQEIAANSDVRYINAQDLIADLAEALEHFFRRVHANSHAEQKRFHAWAEDSGWLVAKLT